MVYLLIIGVWIMKRLINYLRMAKAQIENPMFLFDNRTKASYFTRRTAKMNFIEAIYFILKRLRKTLQIELDEWFEFIDGEKSMTKQASCLPNLP